MHTDGFFFRHYVESNKLNKTDLAKKLGMSKQNIYQLFRSRVFAPATIDNIEKVTGAKWEDIKDVNIVVNIEGEKEKVPTRAPEEDLLKRAIFNLTEDKLESTAVIKRLTGLLELQAQVYLNQLSRNNTVVTSPESEAGLYQDLNPNGGKQKKAGKR